VNFSFAKGAGLGHFISFDRKADHLPRPSLEKGTPLRAAGRDHFAASRYLNVSLECPIVRDGVDEYRRREIDLEELEAAKERRRASPSFQRPFEEALRPRSRALAGLASSMFKRVRRQRLARSAN
jgi:hypothetical protein